MTANAHHKPRIVSLAPSATSILCSIGARRTLVGVTKWCSEVAPVAKLPKLGDCWHMGSVEEILRLKPTLVIGSVPYKQETLAKLLEHPINFLAMNPRTLSDVYDHIRLLGGITGCGRGANRRVSAMQAAFLRYAKRGEGIRKPLRVYCEAWPNPRISSPPWVAELVKICGATMVVPPGEKVSDEQVAEAKPDIIILAWTATGDKPTAQKANEVDAWKEIPAIRNRQVHVVRDELLNTPGPPLVHGAMTLWKLLNGSWQKNEREAMRSPKRTAVK